MTVRRFIICTSQGSYSRQQISKKMKIFYAKLESKTVFLGKYNITNRVTGSTYIASKSMKSPVTKRDPGEHYD